MTFEYTETELETVKNYFETLDPPKLIVFPSKEKKKYLCLLVIRHIFDFDVIYHEKEITELLKPVYHDFVSIRRYLVDYGFLTRKSDGSEYRRLI
jgi:hypothetical protein